MTVNLLFGLPFSSDFTSSKCDEILSNFFALEGKHIVCGGSTAQYVAKFLHKDLVIGLHYENPNIPPVASIDGVDLVTEGIVTMTAVLEKYVSCAVVDTLDENKDGASLIYKALSEADKINFFVSSVENPANGEFDFLKSKVDIVQRLASYLRKQGKLVMSKVI